MRILHTSDWHLGLSTGPASRADEQEWFLDWLLDTMQHERIDALVVAGDVFDSMHPSAEALALYFGFLARTARVGVRDVVVVGGNHDSPSQLDAPNALLEAVGVHVVGGVATTDQRGKRMVVPLRRRGSDDVAAVCLAVPYVHEYRLGIRTTDLDRDGTRAAFETAFGQLYQELADQAQALFPGLPIVATGHLTLGRAVRPEDYPQEIHQVGSIDGLRAELLDPRIGYAALGHIHRCYPVREPSIWYCGTPIAYSLAEARTARKVLVVDLSGAAPPVVAPIVVPASRELLELSGTPDAVLAALEGLRWSTRLPPLVHVRVSTTLAEPGLGRRLHEAVAAHDVGARPVLVDVKLLDPAGSGRGSTPAVPRLEELEPRQVFARMCDAQGLEGEDRFKLEAAFGEVVAASDEILAEMLAAIALPPTGGASS